MVEIPKLETCDKVVEKGGKGLDEINSKILNFQSELEDMKKNNNEEKVLELEEKIKKLKSEKTKIIDCTKKELGNNSKDIPVTKEDKSLLKDEVEKSDLTLEQREEILKRIESSNSSEDLGSDENEIFGNGIGALILKFIAFLTGYRHQRNFDDNFYYNEYSNAKLEILDGDKEKFIKEAKPYALEIEKKFGIPWQVSLAQGALESGWGKSEAAIKDGVYFGVKARKGEEGVSYNTYEDGENGMYKTKASFKKFNGMEDSFYGYAKFLAIDNPRYKNAFVYGYDFNPKPSYYPKEYIGYNPLKFLIEIKNAGYATDKKYVNKVAGVIKSIDKTNI